MNALTRRRFMSLLGGSAASLTIAPLLNCQACAAAAPAFGAGFGPLSPRLPLNTDALNNAVIGDLRNQAILSLPADFDYWIVSPAGDALSDGAHRVPSKHDGMAAFAGADGGIVLVRNHELGTNGGDGGVAVQVPSGATYDASRYGGTTTLTLDRRGQLLSQLGSLAGTERNCAGGPTPWGSWLSCEEAFSTSDAGIRHGYVFEVPAGAEGSIQPLTGLGRFNHEAAAVDPRTGYVYLTEDRSDSLLYRFRSNVYGDLRSGGVLEALQLVDFPGGADTGSGFRQHLFEPLAVTWVPIEQPDPDGESDGQSTRAQGQAGGAAVFRRGEGAWYGNGNIYFVSTSGGDDGGGQVFAHDPLQQSLTLFVEAVRDDADPAYADNGGFLLAAPDNVTVGPDGRLYLCEDGSGVEKLVGVGQDGELYECLRNELNGSEFAGACFSPDGRFLFVNIQTPGLSCVVRGPWRKGRRF